MRRHPDAPFLFNGGCGNGCGNDAATTTVARQWAREPEITTKDGASGEHEDADADADAEVDDDADDAVAADGTDLGDDDDDDEFGFGAASSSALSGAQINAVQSLRAWRVSTLAALASTSGQGDEAATAAHGGGYQDSDALPCTLASVVALERAAPAFVFGRADSSSSSSSSLSPTVGLALVVRRRRGCMLLAFGALPLLLACVFARWTACFYAVPIASFAQVWCC